MAYINRVTATPEIGEPITLQHCDPEALATMLVWVINARGCQHGAVGACASFHTTYLISAEAIYAYLEDMGWELTFTRQEL